MSGYSWRGDSRDARLLGLLCSIGMAWGMAWGIAWLGATEALAAGESYRWIGTEGQVQYGDRPPPGVEAERVRLYTSDPGASQRAWEELDTVILEEERLRKKKEEALKFQEEELAKQRSAEKRCQEAKVALASLAQSGRRLQYRREDGGLADFTEKQKKERLRQVREVQREACGKKR